MDVADGVLNIGQGCSKWPPTVTEINVTELRKKHIEKRHLETWAAIVFFPSVMIEPTKRSLSSALEARTKEAITMESNYRYAS
jgi:hypothetical protein